MVEQSVFRGVIDFFNKLGVYDIILPFLLVFSIMFAILERTKVFGTEEVEGVKITKKNINAMVAFVTAFLVVASSQLVAIINKSLSHVVLLLLIVVCFLILIGTFFSESEEVILKGGWRSFFMVLMFLGIALIFLNAVETEGGQSWLSVLINYAQQAFTNVPVAAVLLVIVIALFMYYVVKEPKTGKSKKEEKKE